jgi:hypothetical protein
MQTFASPEAKFCYQFMGKALVEMHSRRQQRQSAPRRDWVIRHSLVNRV